MLIAKHVILIIVHIHFTVVMLRFCIIMNGLKNADIKHHIWCIQMCFNYASTTVQNIRYLCPINYWHI